MSCEFVTEFKPKGPPAFLAGVRPCGHRLVVWPIERERVTDSGVIIPDLAADREDMAQIDAYVVAIGPGCWVDKTERDSEGRRVMSQPWCKVGDRVKIAKYSGYYHKGPDRRNYRVISDLDIVCVVEE